MEAALCWKIASREKERQRRCCCGACPHVEGCRIHGIMQEIRVEAIGGWFSFIVECRPGFQDFDTEPRSLFRYHALENDELSGKRVDSLCQAGLVSAGCILLDNALPN